MLFTITVNGGLKSEMQHMCKFELNRNWSSFSSAISELIKNIRSVVRLYEKEKQEKESKREWSGVLYFPPVHIIYFNNCSCHPVLWRKEEEETIAKTTGDVSKPYLSSRTRFVIKNFESQQQKQPVMCRNHIFHQEPDLLSRTLSQSWVDPHGPSMYRPNTWQFWWPWPIFQATSEFEKNK